MLIHGDCLEKLKDLDDNSVDLIVTDPPYGYSFMGKEWDKALPDKRIWKECLRVLKHGGFAYVMSAPRQDVLARMMIDLEDSGFNTDFTSMYWAYATGFPKAMNVGKAVDKKLGVESNVVGVGTSGKTREVLNAANTPDTFGGDYNITKPVSNKAKELDGSYAGFQPKPAVEVIIVCMKPLSEKTYLGQAMKDGKGVSWFDDCRIPLSKTSVEDKRLVEGGSWDTSKTAENVYGKYEGKRVEAPMRNAVRNDGVESRGWNNSKGYGRKTTKRQPRNVETVFKKSGFKSEDNDNAEASPAGRFPANLLVSDNAVDNGIESNSIRSKRGRAIGGSGKSVDYGKYNEMEEYVTGYNDKGSFSRYYDLDAWYSQFIITPKASRSEKNKGCESLPEMTHDGVHDNPTRMLSKSNGDVDNRSPKKNIHPTVKPLKLMSYLITLGSREGDVVLDPFMGSGTTPLAAKNMKRKYIGIEREEEYYKICCARVGDEPTNTPDVGVVEITIEAESTICEMCGVDYKGITFAEHESRDFHKRSI